MSNVFESDLVALVADKRMEQALEGILARRESLAIREIRYRILRHPEHDPGCLLRSADFLAMFSTRYRYALVMLDRDGSGGDSSDRTELEARIEGALTVRGWEKRALGIVIDPELEAWVWSTSHHVQRALGWKQNQPSMKDWLIKNGHMCDGAKPSKPKEAMSAILRHTRLPYSPSIYKYLARNVGFSHCIDGAFGKLCTTLSGWFPEQRTGSAS